MAVRWHVRPRATSTRPVLRETRVWGIELVLRALLIGVWVAGMWLTAEPATAPRIAFTLAIGLVYLPLTAALARHPVAGAWVLPRVLTTGVDVALGAAGAYLVPEWRVPILFLYLVLIVSNSITAGGRRGVGVAALATIAATVLALAGGARDTVTIVALLPFASAAFGLPVLISQLVSEHRRHAEHLSRLHTALASIAATPDLSGTFEAIGEAARASVGAMLVALTTVDDDGTALTVRTVAGREVPVPELTSRSIELSATLPAWSPSQLAARTGRPVSVLDAATETRFGRWATEAATAGVGAMVAVPLRTGETVIGALNAYWATGDRGPTREDVDLLAAYVEGASLSVLRAQAYEQERRAATALRAAERARSEFTASIAHELRTPLTTIRGFIETLLMREDALTASQRRHMLEVSRRNAVDLTQRISGLLEHSKLEGDHVTVDPRVQLLGPAIATALDNCSGLTSAHELIVAIPDGILVELDEVALDHILSNLVGNAAKYSPEGSAISIEAEVVGDEVVVSVADQGTGIPADDLANVFDRFYRAGSQGGRRGTGIGLAIVQRYVELSRGRVWVESVEGAGAVFRFSLPYAGSAPTPRTPLSAIGELDLTTG